MGKGWNNESDWTGRGRCPRDPRHTKFYPVLTDPDRFVCLQLSAAFGHVFYFRRGGVSGRRSAPKALATACIDHTAR